MNVIFYKFSGEANLVDKTNALSNSVTLQCNLKDNTSVINPSILLNMSAINRNVTTYNYCYIELFGRYYFIDDVIIEANNIIRFNLSVDVLMSYKTFLFGQKALVSRNRYISQEGAPYCCVDNRMQFYNTFNTKGYESEIVFPVIENPDDESWFCITLFGTVHTAPIINGIDPYHTMSYTYIFRNDRTQFPLETITWIGSLISSDNEKYASFVSSLFAIPFDPRKYLFIGESGNIVKANKIYFGPTEVDVSLREFYIINPLVNTEFRIDLPIYSYKDLSPYTEWYIDLPLKGQFKIPEEVMKDGYVSGEFLMDFTVGTGTYKLKRLISTPESPTFTRTNIIEYMNISVECLCPLPINTTNAGAINRQKEAYLGSFWGNTVAGASGVSALGGAALAASLGVPVLGAAAGLLGVIGGAVGGAIKYNADVKALTVSGSSNQGASIFNNLDVKNNRASVNNRIILMEYRRLPIYEDDDEIYRSLNGYVCNKTLTLDAVYGYTEISDIHLEIPSILTDESEMLMSLLTSGVIFPDPPT